MRDRLPGPVQGEHDRAHALVKDCPEGRSHQAAEAAFDRHAQGTDPDAEGQAADQPQSRPQAEMDQQGIGHVMREMIGRSLPGLEVRGQEEMARGGGGQCAEPEAERERP